jgi:hypothetical protein
MGLWQNQWQTIPNPPLTLLLSASSTAFWSCSATKWDRLMADLSAMMAARQTAVGGNTLNIKTKAWNCYTKYCKSIRLGNNIFLKGMSRWLCIKDDFLDHAMLPWLKSQSHFLSTRWLWSSGKTYTTAPNGTRSATLTRRQRCMTFATMKATAT